MSEIVKKRGAMKWALWGLLGVIALLFIAAVGLRIFITTPAGSRLIEDQINSRSFGPIEGVEVKGLSGDPLKGMTITSVKIRDKDGVWATADDIRLKWQPLKFKNKHLYIENLEVAAMNVLRKPVLNETPPSESNASDTPFTMTLDNFETPSLSLGEAVMGQTVSAKIKAQYALNDTGSMRALLDAVRTDIKGDAVTLDFTRSPKGLMKGDFKLTGLPDGTIATLIQAPAGQTVKGEGVISGDVQSGDGTLSITFDEMSAVDLNANWTEETLSIAVQAETQNWPLLAPAREIDTQIKGGLTLQRDVKLKPFELNIQAGGASLSAQGDLPEEGFVPETARITADIPNLSRFYALPDAYKVGGITLDGQVTNSDKMSFQGHFNVSSVAAQQGQASAVSGPVLLYLSGDKQLADFETTLSIKGLKLTADIPLALKSNISLAAKGQYDLGQKSLKLNSSKLISGQDTATASGRLTTDPLTYDLKGRANLGLKAIGSLPPGQLTTDYKAVQTKNGTPAITADGRFAPSQPLDEPLSQLIGTMVVFDIAASPVTGGIEFTRGNVSGDGVRAAFSGRVTETLDVDIEGTLKQAVTFKSVTLAEGTEVSGTVTGPRASPNIRLQATTSELTAYDRVISNVRLRTEIDDILNAPKGPIQFDAASDYGDVTVSAQFSSTENILRLADLRASVGKLTASGNVSLPENGIAAGQIALDLPEEDGRYARANLDLENLQGEQGVALSIDAKNVAYQTIELETLTAKLQGTLASLTGALQTEGQMVGKVVDTPFKLNTPITVSRDVENKFLVTLTPEAAYGRIPIQASEPVRIEYAGGEVNVSAALKVSDGTMNLTYQKGEQERLIAKAENLPMNIFPLGNFMGDTKGRVAMDVDLSVPNSQPQGKMTVRVNDWRGFERSEGKGLSIIFDGALSAANLDWTLRGSSEEDFKLDGSGQIALQSENSLASIRPNMTAPLTAKLAANGAAGAVLGLVAPKDAGLSGQLQANLDVTGSMGAPLISGEAGGEAIKFEMIELGTQIKDGTFLARFSNDNVNLERLSVNDGQGGTFSGSGDFKLGEFGVPIGQANFKAKGFHALDRRDMSGRVSGDISFKTTKEQGTLAGTVEIERAEITQFVSGGAGVVTIEVEEINLPPQRQAVKPKVAPYPVALDVKVKAPRRIFIRSRGLDIEMSIDAEIKGTPIAPEIYGEASIVRGGYKIAGKQLDFESGIIKFDGPVSTASIDFVASTQTQNLEAGVKITGTVETPEIELSSTPTRPDDEILSALLFGRSATELSAIEAAQLAGALAQFSGNGGGLDLLGGVRDALGVGQLSLGVDEDGAAQLTGGRYLSRNVYLQIFSGVGAADSGAVIDWEIKKNLSLRSRVQSDNEQALALKWKRDF